MAQDDPFGSDQTDYANIERLMQERGGKQYHTGDKVDPGMAFSRPFSGTNDPSTWGQKAGPFGGVTGPQDGSWYVPTDVYNQIYPQTAGDSGLGGLLNVPGEIAGGSLPGLAIPAIAAGVNAVGPAMAAGDAGAGSAGASMVPTQVASAGSDPFALAQFSDTTGASVVPGTEGATGINFAAPLTTGSSAVPQDGTTDGSAPAGGAAMLNATSPLTTLDPSTAAALGIAPEASALFSGLDTATLASANLAGAGEGGMTLGTLSGGFDPSAGFPGADLIKPDYIGDIPTDPAAGTGSTTDPSVLDKASGALKKLGLSPATAALLGISGAQALSSPKLPAAAQKLQSGAGPAADAANSLIQSGGMSSPAFATQKASIDAAIDQQIKEQSAAMVQQAVNSGQGADSQVTLQQINKLKTQLEAQRQALYAQAAQQNVSTAVQQLGISDQALAQVANAQFAEDNQAKASASETAKMALMIQSLSKG